jgi:deoxyadenosine/deoxycytidine kinase
MVRDTPRIVIVGVCGSGKSVLTRALRERGYNARSVAQEHSLIAGMWRAHGQPNILICLDAEPQTINARLGRNDWTSEMVAEQRRRLADARKYCDLYLPTDTLTERQVLERVLAFLREGWPDAP